jgi:hypothetical protein
MMKNSLNPKIHLIEFEYGTSIRLSDALRWNPDFNGIWHPDVYATELMTIISLVDKKSRDYDVILLISALVQEKWGAHLYVNGSRDMREQLIKQAGFKSLTDHIAEELEVSILVVADDARLAIQIGRAHV